MTCWEILGIEQTSQRKLIRKAYAEKLREIDTEIDGEKFQQLKEAYDRAVAWYQHREAPAKTVLADELDLFGDRSNQEQPEKAADAFFEAPETLADFDFLEDVTLVTADDALEAQERAKRKTDGENLAFMDVAELDQLAEMVRFEENQSIPDFWLLEKAQLEGATLDETARKFYALFEEIYQDADYFEEDSEWRVLFAEAKTWSEENRQQIALFMLRFVLHFGGALSYTVIFYLEKVLKKFLQTSTKLDLTAFNELETLILDMQELPYTVIASIPQALRGRFLIARWQLWVLLREPEIDQDKWLEYLKVCEDITGLDPIVDIFRCEKLLWEDFRLEHEATVLKMRQLLKFMSMKNLTAKFLTGYLAVITDPDNTSTELLTLKKSKLLLPRKLYKLLAGNLCYHGGEWKKAKKYWKSLASDETLDLFNETEKKRMQEVPGKFAVLASSGLFIWLIWRIAIFVIRHFLME